MPRIGVELEIAAPVERVWKTVLDVERYSDSMSNVRWVRLVEDGAERRRTAWSVVLKGSILEWEEQEEIDAEARVIRFHQLEGDLDVFDGHWTVEESEAGRARIRFEVEFEIGIPLLADMLNPVAKRSLAENCTEMLLGIERSVVQA